MKIELEPIGFVRGGRREIVDDDWGEVRATIELDGARFTEEALVGLDEFSHVEVLFHFHKADPRAVEEGARHPRGNTAWPRTGIFAQRGKDRPNGIGLTTCRLLSIRGTRLEVQGLDAIDGTPVLDVKPCVSGFAPRGTLREPDWSREIMANYWSCGEEGG